MAKELPYFKFEPAQWMFGRIQRQDANTQVAFINLCCKYWHELGNVNYEDACLDFGKPHIDNLVASKIIANDSGHVRIKFLDNQLNEFGEYSKKQSERGKLSGAKRRLNLVQPPSTTVQPPVNNGSTTGEPIRGEDRREDKKKRDKKIFIPPSEADVCAFVQAEGYPLGLATHVFKYYNDADWYDSNEKKVKNWKQKLRGVWLKPENKLKYADTKPAYTLESMMENNRRMIEEAAKCK